MRYFIELRPEEKKQKNKSWKKKKKQKTQLGRGSWENEIEPRSAWIDVPHTMLIKKYYTC